MPQDSLPEGQEEHDPPAPSIGTANFGRSIQSGSGNGAGGPSPLKVARNDGLSRELSVSPAYCPNEVNATGPLGYVPKDRVLPMLRNAGMKSTNVMLSRSTPRSISHTGTVDRGLVGLWFITPEVEILGIAAVWTAHIGFGRPAA
jgi:hypothetical protein